MPITKVHKSSNYTVMSNYHLQDKNLNLKSKGLMSYVLSLPENWDYSIAGLETKLPDGKTAISTALKELEKFGYLIRRKIYTNGKISDMEYHFYEHPLDIGKQEPENQEQENNSQININQNNLSKESIKGTKKEEIDTESVYPHLSKILNSSIIPLLKQYLSRDTMDYLEKNKIEEWKIDSLMWKLENKVEPIRNQLAYVKTILQSMKRERI